jgi:hypothetical protein
MSEYWSYVNWLMFMTIAIACWYSEKALRRIASSLERIVEIERKNHEAQAEEGK